MIGLKIEDALKLNKDLKKYITYKNGKARIDFKNKEALYLYNKTILEHLFGLNMEFHKDALIPTPINRYLFIKNIFDENPHIKNVLEIGTGSGIISILIAKHYNCKIYMTDTVEEYVDLAQNNIENNYKNIKINNPDDITVINSNGKIINGIKELENIKFDLIISYPPFYDDNSVASKRSFGGADATSIELIGGGKYGEKFSCDIIMEGSSRLNKNGLIAIMLPEKPIERRKAIENKIIDMGLILKSDDIKTGKRVRHIIKGHNKDR
ncbi:RlmF-related methyltransferase [Methanococcus aeolicus]|uniref:RlmF-related methyltransferase n=1 Tax=Methanococcus aeolicus TaxID=42879 RepID=UPI0021CA5C82|nr:RlmF-related methyltransferase [Methanococcus aeolicus]UXM84306.1 RlmF-related methyltransferase [Methanococcus aeolicus]